jgi:hypothetical protein
VPGHTGQMASQAKLTIRVRAQRGGCTIQYSTNGRYISLPTNGLTATLTGQPIQPTSTAQAFWTSVLAIVTPSITTHP